MGRYNIMQKAITLVGGYLMQIGQGKLGRTARWPVETDVRNMVGRKKTTTKRNKQTRKNLKS